MSGNKKIAFQYRIIAILGFALVIVVASAILVFGSLREIVNDISQEARPDDNLILIKEVLVDLTDLENAAKTYSLTQELSNLTEFETGQKRLDIKMAKLIESSDENESLHYLDSLILEKIAILEEFLLVQNKYNSAEILDEVLATVHNIESDVQNEQIEMPQEEKEKFFKKIFNRKKAENSDTEPESSESSTTEQLEELDSELVQIRNRNSSSDILRKEQELELIHKDYALTAEILLVVNEIEEIENEKLANEIKMAEQKGDMTVGWILIYCLITCAFLIFSAFAIYRYVKKNNEYKNSLRRAKEITEEKNLEITSSINYAKRIQTAILPDLKKLNSYFPESFILYRPKDIVAGDFYWTLIEGNRIFLAVADCTGHGVPGAMVSVVCHSALTKCVKEFGLRDPAEILNSVREIIQDTFEERDESVIYDGMDINLCVIDVNTKIVEYAGANNSLYVLSDHTETQFRARVKSHVNPVILREEVQDKFLYEVSADKQPVARYFNPKPFTKSVLELEVGDAIYLFTDGFPDQFGGPKSKKFTYKKFRELIVNVGSKSMEKQQKELEKEIDFWQGDTEQIDDICVLGLKF